MKLKSRIALASLAVVTIFLVACPMPQVGMGPTKEAAGDTEQGTPVGAGASISVINDEARNLAVYINENGQRFDVVAEEYPGGPQVACVQVAGFTLVPASTDPDALPVKVLVAGTRDDGNPSVWEIHNDDSIHLSQPETDPTGERCIIQDQMTSLPDGIQARLGWKFVVSDVKTGPDGKSGLIIGYAQHRNGLAVAGVQLLPDTTVALYWRVYSLLGGRFCIVSAPRIIGSFEEAPLPSQIAARWPGRSPLLQRLWSYLYATLKTYLVADPTKDKGGLKIERLLADNTTFQVSGTSDKGLPALATIPKSGSITIQTLVPNLRVSSFALSNGNPTASDPWSITATIVNEGTGPADNLTVQYFLSDVALNASPFALGSLAANDSTSVTSPEFKLPPGYDQPGATYTVSVHAVATYSDATGQGSITVASPVPSDRDPPTLTLVKLASSNANPALAKVGDTVTVSFTASEALDALPSVTIGGSSVTVEAVENLHFTAGRLMSADDPQGPVVFLINFKDVAGNTGAAVSATTDGSSVTFDNPPADTTPPVITINSPTDGQTLHTTVVSYSLSEQVSGGSVTWTVLAGGTPDTASPHVVNLPETERGAGDHTVAFSNVGLIGGAKYSMSIAAADPAGNTGAASISMTYATTYDHVVVDTYDPAAPGETAGNTTEITLFESDKTTSKPDWHNVGGADRTGAGQEYAYVNVAGLTSGYYWVFVDEWFDLTDTFDCGVRVTRTLTTYDGTWKSPDPNPSTLTLNESSPDVANPFNHLVTTLSEGNGVWIQIYLP